MSSYKYYEDTISSIDKLEEEMTDAGKPTGWYADENGRPIKSICNFPYKVKNISEIDYKYSEDKILKELTEYIDATYGQHYSQNKYQATEFIIDGGHGIGFTIGNIMKYAQRYQHKGTPEDWRKDLMKVLHYAIIAIHTHDLEYNKG